ncbi:MAG: cytochrome-c peroxidase [Flavobacteriaceae bacterium]|nr:cytochrome-c peroxidase [Flavobacteriaceae bacterium]
MKKIRFISFLFLVFFSCTKDDVYLGQPIVDNPEIILKIPEGFPELNSYFYGNKPTKFGVELGEKFFNDKRFSIDNSISCSSCHQQSSAFADNEKQAIGVFGRIGLRNTPPIQNLAFMRFYNWDGSKLRLEKQPIVPIITHEEMDSSILEVISKIENDIEYKELLKKVFGDDKMTPERIYKTIAQYEYTLISANSKYDKVKRNETTFTENEAQGYQVFQQKCISCHSGALFTDQSFRNIGFPVNLDSNEGGRARVTGDLNEYMSFRVPSLRNIEYTAPYGSFGQFPTLKSVLDYLSDGVLNSENLDPILKDNNNRIPLSDLEKQQLIDFMNTLSDNEFINK